MLPLSVILPVYHKVSTAEFARSLNSVLTQTRPAHEVIVVVDGPVPPELDGAVDDAERDNESVRVLRLPQNRGVAAAMRAGLEVAESRWIARQDADDVSMPDRFERLWPLIETGNYAAIGGSMLEFAGNDPTNVVRVRKLPASPKALARYVKSNSPMNNPTVVFDAEAVAEVGGIRDVHLMEDYDMFARLIAGGYALRNVDEPVVLFNANEGMFDRRTGREMAAAERAMQSNLVRYGLISRPRAQFNYLGRQAFRRLPRPLLKAVYGILFDRGKRPEAGAAVISTTEERA